MNILFLCVANSARSQIAEGLAKKIFGSNHLIQRAGSNPSKVNPLEEIGIDIKNQYSKSVNDIDTKNIDIVITLCQEEVCPTFLGNAKKYHFPFPDPAKPNLSEEEQLKLFREVRDKIKAKLEEMKDTILK
ncbi:MAG: arsenate reductase [Candidatus Sericytochromatia bacterium]|nr:MAG: arsenate reductase [Candidatus Sericytochromatia bacterium]